MDEMIADPWRQQFRANNPRMQYDPAAESAKSTAALDAYNDPARRTMAAGTRALGIPDFTGHNLISAAEFLPGVGDAMDAQDSAIAFGKGDYLTGGLLGGAAAIGLVPGVGDALGGAIGGMVKGTGKAADALTDARKGIRASRGAGDVTRYGLEHRPMTVKGGASTLDDLTPAFGEDIYSPNAMQYFGSGDPREKEVLRILAQVRNNPEAPVRIYRGAPDGVTDINPGDWVTLSRDAASDYGNILEMDVPASHVTGWADSLLEQGYYPPQGIRAYHGSPHDFDKFDISKIGTGEGAQAYGHGLYFAGQEGVAKSYRDALSGKIGVQPVAIDGVKYEPPTEAHQRAAAIIAKDGRGSALDVINSLRREGYLDSDVESAYREVLRLTKGKTVTPLQSGHMYEVNINADPEDFLDWDKPLREQPESIQNALGWSPEMRDLYTRNQSALDNDLLSQLGQGGTPLGDDVRKRLEKEQHALKMSAGVGFEDTGYDALRNDRVEAFRGARSPEARSARLREAGIPGIKYLDQGSRAAGEGSQNYVVFDDKLIDLVRKYGLAALLAGGGFGAWGMAPEGGEQPPL